RGASSTALCSQCHIRPAGWEGSANPNASTQPTAYPIGASATNFGGHLIGKQFLNSPHGKFTGAYAQIATRLDLYNSRFSDGTRQGGCDTCHDVHQSTIVKIYPFDYPDDFALASSLATPLAVSGTPVPIRRECVVCHIDKEDLATIRHPGGVGTPQGDGSNVADACKSCHMPKPPLGGGALGLYVHVMRINTDPNYSTFPKAGATTPGICSDPYYKTRAACIANGKSWSLVANSAPDGNFTEAVWVDLGLACGKCHFEGGGAIVMTKRQLAQYAKGIHGAGGNTNLPPIASGVESATVSNLTVTFVDKSFDDSSFAKTDIMDPNYNLRIAVSWGDGTIDTGLAGSTFQHTYRSAGAKTIRQTATDTGGLKGFKRVTVNVGQ
ncbi:MAG TPA: hypothetical protein VLK23_06710, partial [Thermodesulfobacteriota bacterium]|nr:hypothetical protein [Thermodesulfobacteriota bacterium]